MQNIGVLKNGGLKAAYAIRATRVLDAPTPPPRLPPQRPEPPSFLSPLAQDEWWRAEPSLHVLGQLSAIDVACVAACCQAYAHWHEAEAALAKLIAMNTCAAL